jgi:hypothetical protein
VFQSRCRHADQGADGTLTVMAVLRPGRSSTAKTFDAEIAIATSVSRAGDVRSRACTRESNKGKLSVFEATCKSNTHSKHENTPESLYVSLRRSVGQV